MKFVLLLAAAFRYLDCVECRPCPDKIYVYRDESVYEYVFVGKDEDGKCTWQSAEKSAPSHAYLAGEKATKFQH